MPRIAAIILILLPLICTAAPTVNPDRSTLKDIGEVAVVVEGLPAKLSGLNPDTIRKEAVSRLNAAGIRVSDKAMPFLYIRVTLKKNPGAETHSYCVQVRLLQLATLISNGAICLPTTWEEIRVGQIPGNQGLAIAADISALVDRFTEDYRAANTGRKQ